MAVKVHDTIQANIRQSDKVNSSLSIQLNGGTATIYNGSSSKSINITPSAIGAPTTNGSGASGTWGINISGNAAKVNGVIPEWAGSVAWADTNWIAAWTSDGTKIKALNKNSFAPASHTHNYLPLTGGTISGSLDVAGNITGNYIQGTWLYTSAATALSSATKIAVIHTNNYIYYISPANLATLIKNNASGSWNINATTATKLATARTISLTGAITGSGSFDGSGNLSINTSYAITLNPTYRTDNVTGYRLIATSSTGPWRNLREIWFVVSRHTGCGMLSFCWGNNASSPTLDTAYGQIVYSGVKTGGSVLYTDAFQIYYNASKTTFYLFWKYLDYNTTNIIKILSSSSDGGWTIANGVDMTTIDTSIYGNLICQTTPCWIVGESITNAIWN